jgi:hypothetical protein
VWPSRQCKFQHPESLRHPQFVTLHDNIEAVHRHERVALLAMRAWRRLLGFLAACANRPGYAWPIKTLLILFAALLCFAQTLTAASAQPAPAKEFLPPLPAGKEWRLIWNDEFDGSTRDETKWNRLGDYVAGAGVHGVVRENDPARPLKISVEGADELRLVAGDAGDGIECDCADWAEARLTRNLAAVNRPAETAALQALTVMLILHACGPAPERPVDLATAHQAALLTALLHGHQLALRQKVGGH